MKIQLSTTLFAAVATGASYAVVAARRKDGSALRRGNAAAADAPAALRRLKKTIAAGAAPDAEADQAPPPAAAKSNADALADALEAVAAWISRKDAPVDVPLLKKSLRSLDEAARREGEIPKMKKKKKKADSSVASGAAAKGSSAPGVSASDLIAAAGELIDAILELGRDGALSREAVEAKLRAIADQLAAAPSPSDDAPSAGFRGAMTATLKDVIEDTLIQVIKAPRPVDADFLKTMARRLEGDRLVLPAAASPGKITDTGILGTKKSVVDSPVDAMPGDRQLQTPGYVDCDDGEVYGLPGTSCKDACDGDCCVGGTSIAGTQVGYYREACYGFTGRVFKDGSCDGFQACLGANIPTVMGGSCDGYNACRFASIPIVTGGSCVGDSACKSVGNGTVGYVASISNGSCVGRAACDGLAFYGTVGNITGSCVGDYPCLAMASNGGTVGDISASCNDQYACILLAYEIGGFGPQFGGTVGDVESSCNGYRACYSMANFTGAEITGLTGCCNGDSIGGVGECEGDATDADLPSECSSSTETPTAPPSKGPTAGPTGAPSTSPTGAPTSGTSESPTAGPTASPSAGPSVLPTASPVVSTGAPSTPPTGAPTSSPSESPTAGPTGSPSAGPSVSPTAGPTKAPSESPTKGPSESSTKAPTEAPTSINDVVSSAKASLSAYLDDEKNNAAAKALHFLEKIDDTSPFQNIRDAATASETLGCPDVEAGLDEACELICQVITLYANQIA